MCNDGAKRRSEPSTTISTDATPTPDGTDSGTAATLHSGEASASAIGSAQTLPEDWTCDRCGKTSAETTVFWPRSRMDLDERVTLKEYGVDEGQFFDGKDVALCGQCNGSHWSAPNDQTLPTEGAAKKT